MTGLFGGKILSVPNFFSYLRIALTFPAVYLLIKNTSSYNAVAAGLVIFAGVTDFLDGFFARKLNQVSELGKIVDPVADKIFISGIMITLVFYRGFPLWFALPVILRDVVIIILSSFIFSKKKIVISSNMTGKVTMFIYCFSVGTYMINWESMQLPSCIIGTAMVAVSSVHYLILLKKGR